MRALKRWVSAHPVVAFFILTFVISWASWLPMAAYNRGLVDASIPALYFIGGIGPGIAAWIVLRIIRGGSAETDLFGPLLRWRVHWKWWVVAILLFPVIWCVAALIVGKLDSHLASIAPSWGIAVALIGALFAAIPEELGWRGFALSALQTKYSALTASLIVGVVWALWHLPLLLGANPFMSTYPLGPFLLWVVAASVLYAWVYNSTRGSVLIVVILHAFANLAGAFTLAPWAIVAVAAAVAVVVTLIFGSRELTRTGRRITPIWMDTEPPFGETPVRP